MKEPLCFAKITANRHDHASEAFHPCNDQAVLACCCMCRGQQVDRCDSARISCSNLLRDACDVDQAVRELGFRVRYQEQQLRVQGLRDV